MRGDGGKGGRLFRAQVNSEQVSLDSFAEAGELLCCPERQNSEES